MHYLRNRLQTVECPATTMLHLFACQRLQERAHSLWRFAELGEASLMMERRRPVRSLPRHFAADDCVRAWSEGGGVACALCLLGGSSPASGPDPNTPDSVYRSSAVWRRRFGPLRATATRMSGRGRARRDQPPGSDRGDGRARYLLMPGATP